MKKLIVFDWNGTLLADVKACMDTDNYILKKFGGRPVTLKTWRNTITIPAIDFYTQHGCSRSRISDEAKIFSETFHAFYEQRVAHCRLRSGAKDLLQWLNQHSYKTIILSNHTVTGIQQQLKKFGIEKNISEILANAALTGALQRRNKIEKLKAYLKKHHYHPKNVIIIGDSPEEIEIGKKLGITSVAISNGYYATARLKVAQPDFAIQSLKQLTRMIKELI